MSAVAGLIAHGWIEPAEAHREIETALEDEEPHTRIAIANAAKLRFAPLYRAPLLRLASDPDPDVAREAVRAMRSSEDAWFTEPLVGLLADRRVREVAREALIDRGEAALAILTDALLDDGTPSAVRRHVPRTISRFATPAALEILLDALGRVESGMVRYKVLRGLQPMVASPAGRRAARERVLAELESTVERVLDLLHREAGLVRGREERLARRTPGGRLLVDLLDDKRKLATRRVFLLLSLLHPAEDFRRIRRALDSPRPVDRASGFELIESLLPHDLAQAILGVSGAGSALERLAAADPERAEDRMSYDAIVRDLQEDPSQIVRVFAMYHASELALLPEDDADRTSRRDGREAQATLRARALRTLERLPEALARRMIASERATEA